MSIKLSYDSSSKFLYILIQGNLKLQEIEESLKEIINSKEYPADVDSLWDVRELEFSDIDMEFLRGIVAIRKKYNDKRQEAKIAILSNYMLAAPIVKLYTIVQSGLRQKTKVFKTIVEAECWLCEDTLTGSK